MSLIRTTQAVEYRVHGMTFRAYVGPKTGSRQLCAWRLIVPANQIGAQHRPTREEILLILEGDLRITVERVANRVTVGDVLLVPANSELRIDGGLKEATVWVTTTAGLEAVMSDGSRLAPPWAN